MKSNFSLEGIDIGYDLQAAEKHREGIMAAIRARQNEIVQKFYEDLLAWIHRKEVRDE